MNERRFYELIDVAGPLPSETNAQISSAIEMLPSGHPARTVLIKAATANSKVGQRIQDLRDWGAESFGDPARNIPDPRTAPPSTPPASRPRLTEAEREAHAEHPRLTGAALRAVLTGDVKNGLPGIKDEGVVRWYVNQYAPGQGGLYSNSTYSTVAQMDDDELGRMRAKYPNPADWMKRELHNNDNYIAIQMGRTPTWPDLLRMAGRA